MTQSSDLNIISITSQVSHGAVGNAAIVPSAHLLGCGVAAIPTVNLSNHPGLGPPVIQETAPGYIQSTVELFIKQKWSKNFQALLSGYFRTPQQVEEAARAVEKLKSENPEFLYLCDPIIGDHHTGVYVHKAVATTIRDRLVPLADVITPNSFELAWLAGEKIASFKDVARIARSMNCPVCLVSSAPVDDPTKLATAVVETDHASLVISDRQDNVPHGTGDLLSVVFLIDYLQHRNYSQTLALATARIEAVISHSKMQILNLPIGLAAARNIAPLPVKVMT